MARGHPAAVEAACISEYLCLATISSTPQPPACMHEHLECDCIRPCCCTHQVSPIRPSHLPSHRVRFTRNQCCRRETCTVRKHLFSEAAIWFDGRNVISDPVSRTTPVLISHPCWPKIWLQPNPGPTLMSGGDARHTSAMSMLRHPLPRPTPPIRQRLVDLCTHKADDW